MCKACAEAVHCVALLVVSLPQWRRAQQPPWSAVKEEPEEDKDQQLTEQLLKELVARGYSTLLYVLIILRQVFLFVYY